MYVYIPFQAEALSTESANAKCAVSQWYMAAQNNLRQYLYFCTSKASTFALVSIACGEGHRDCSKR